MLVQSRQALTEALIEAKREMNYEPKMEGLLMIERNIEEKPSLLLTLFILEIWHGNVLLAVVGRMAGGREFV